MDKKEFEKSIHDIFSSMLSSRKGEVEKDSLFKLLLSKPDKFEDPEKLSLYITFPFKEVVYDAVTEMVKTNDWLVRKIYLDYGFFKRNLDWIITNFYGGACSADRSRFVLSYVIKLKLGQKLPDWNQSYYWCPENGSAEDWVEFVEALGSLHHGNPNAYLASMIKMTKINERQNNER